jgi:hypothetical protein
MGLLASALTRSLTLNIKAAKVEGVYRPQITDYVTSINPYTIGDPVPTTTIKNDPWKTYKVTDGWIYDDVLSNPYNEEYDSVFKQLEKYLEQQDKKKKQAINNTKAKVMAPKDETRDEMTESPDCGPALAEMINGL